MWTGSCRSPTGDRRSQDVWICPAVRKRINAYFTGRTVGRAGPHTVCALLYHCANSAVLRYYFVPYADTDCCEQYCITRSIESVRLTVPFRSLPSWWSERKIVPSQAVAPTLPKQTGLGARKWASLPAQGTGGAPCVAPPQRDAPLTAYLHTGGGLCAPAVGATFYALNFDRVHIY